MTPMEPSIEAVSHRISSAAAGEPVAPGRRHVLDEGEDRDALLVGEARMRAAISEDWTGEPPGELIWSATAAGLPGTPPR
jgi:hypothetical protein